MQRLSGLSASTLRVGPHLGARAAPKIVGSPHSRTTSAWSCRGPRSARRWSA